MRTEAVGKWKLNAEERVSVGDFNNVTDTALAVFPGQREGESLIKVKNSSQRAEAIAYNEDEYQYSRFGDGYFYGINNENAEVIAFADPQGMLVPIYAGAGSIRFSTKEQKVIFEARQISAFKETERDGYPAVEVLYTVGGEGAAVRKAGIVYVFKERCLSAQAEAYCIGIDEEVATAVFARPHLNQSESYTKRVAYDWIYPEDNDFAYREVDAFIISEKFGKNTVYAALRDRNATNKIAIKPAVADEFQIGIKTESNGCSAEFCVDYAFVESGTNESYKGLFKTRNMDFAAGIAAVNEADNTSIFRGKNLDLNINVTNISKSDINFCVKYNIMDYYNTCVDSAVFYTNILPSGGQANRNINTELENYGMYYLNLYVATKDYEYRECYPFCMLEDFSFKYRDENPFGICATHTDTVGQGISTASIVDKMGLSMVRLGISYDQRHFINLLREHNVKRYCVAQIRWCHTPEGVDDFVDTVKKYCEDYPDDTYFLMANETDSPTKANYRKAIDYLNNTFVPYTYKPVYDYLSENHPEKIKKTIWQSNCHGTTEWLEAFYESGMWDNSEIIDIHSYSSPSGPDKVFSNTYMSMHANTFSNEYAMERWKRIKKRYGEKRMMVGETGYPMPPANGTTNTAELDIRTGADFNVRIALFFLEAGAEDIIFYCLFDRTSQFVGTSSWNEMYFGAGYNEDYYGVYLPKPWTAALANLTRRFDGYKKVTFFDKYEEGEYGTLRAFKAETKENEFAVLWSNIYKQPNTTAEGRVNGVKRIPMPAWENRWIETEIREFDAVGDTVTVIDVMGNEKTVKAENGKVSIEVSGSPIFVYGIC